MSHFPNVSEADTLVQTTNMGVYIVAFAIQTPNGDNSFTQWWKEETRSNKKYANEPDLPAYRFRNIYREELFNHVDAGPVDMFIALVPQHPNLCNRETLPYELMKRSRQYSEDVNFLSTVQPQYTGLEVCHIQKLLEHRFLDREVMETILALVITHKETLHEIVKNMAEATNMFRLALAEAWRSYSAHIITENLTK